MKLWTQSNILAMCESQTVKFGVRGEQIVCTGQTALFSRPHTSAVFSESGALF